ncbi:hypothetical protein JXA80_03510 [bacterium]|nr:hypothetical protein [candidate division CSSED10-310 bacterium]
MDYSLIHISEDTFRTEWDDFVLGNGKGTLFHTWRWLAGFLEKPELIIVTDRNGGIVGGMCLIARRKAGVRGFHVPPYTPYFGPVIHDFPDKKPVSALAQQEKILNLLLENLRHIPHCDFILPPGTFSILPYYWSGFSIEVRTTFTIVPSIESWENAMEKSPRSHLRKLRQGVADGSIHVHVGHQPDEIFYQMIESVGKRKKFNARIELLKRVIDGLQQDDVMTVSVVDGCGELLAGDLCLIDPRRVYMLASFRHPEWKSRCPNEHLLVRSESIRLSYESGRVFDFEGSMLRGVADFNRSLGAQPDPVYRVQRSKSLCFTTARFIRRLMHEYGYR